MSTFAQLQFANHNARIHGADLSGSGTLWNSRSFGQGKMSGVAGWLHGERLDTQTPLYQMMPLNARSPSMSSCRDSRPALACRQSIANRMWTRTASSKSRRDTRSSICTRG